jgi:hypothetical protein
LQRERVAGAGPVDRKSGDAADDLELEVSH